MTCRAVCGRQLTDTFQVLRQGCLLSPLLFLLVLKTSTTQRGNGIQWTPWAHLDDLDFANDLASLSHAQWQMQEKTGTVADNSARLGLKVHRGKTKVLENNAAVSTTHMSQVGDGLEDVTSFTYLGTIVTNEGGTDADVKSRTGRARAPFLQTKNI